MNWKSLLTALGREAVRVLERKVRSGRNGSAPSSTKTTKQPYVSGGEPSPYGPDSAREIDPEALPHFDYAPHMDGDADPGEVVWTWVPYEDVPEVGKDRPVLVLARLGQDLVVVQLTSKDKDDDRAEEARYGRYWIDIGSGDWDRKGRPSEARIDRLLRVGQPAIRREGGILGEGVFRDVVAAVTEAHARGL